MNEAADIIKEMSDRTVKIYAKTMAIENFVKK